MSEVKPTELRKELLWDWAKPKAPVVEWVTREYYEDLVSDGISNDKDAGGYLLESEGRTPREYVESYLREQYKIYGEDGFRIGERVEAGAEGTDEHDAGRILAINGDSAEVGWDSGTRTSISFEDLRGSK